MRDVSIERGDTRVLDRVSFDVVDRIREGCITGQVVSLLGPSGIGKTTLLRVLAGLERPSAGKVIGPEGAALDARTVGIVFQHYPLLAHRTIEDNLVVAGRVGGLEEHRAQGPCSRAHGARRHRGARELLPCAALRRTAPARGDRAAARAAHGACSSSTSRSAASTRRRSPTSTTLVTEVANDHELNTVVIVTHDVRAALRVSDTILLLGKSANDGERSGASVRATYDLVELGLAWEHGERAPRAVAELEHEIETRFRELA